MLQNVDTIASMLVLTGLYVLVWFLGHRMMTRFKFTFSIIIIIGLATFGGVKGSWLDQQLLAADERECAPTERKSN